MTHWNILLNWWPVEDFQKLFCLMVFFLTVAFVQIYILKTSCYLCPLWVMLQQKIILNIEILKFYVILKSFMWLCLLSMLSRIDTNHNKSKSCFWAKSCHSIIFIEIWKFWMFLNQTLSQIFVSWNSACLLTLYKSIQTRVPESGHTTVKYFTEMLEFNNFLKIRLSYISLP